MMKVRLILTLALLLLCAGAALAQTPDGLPPSLETVCDLEQGSAYGYCNAYCEAMDCDSPNPQASPTACARVRSKFQQTTGREVSCEAGCPCADRSPEDSKFAAYLAGQIPAEGCVKNANGVAILEDIEQPNDFIAFATSADGQGVCGYVLPEIALPISLQQVQNCADLLEQAANSQGLTCTPE